MKFYKSLLAGVVFSTMTSVSWALESIDAGILGNLGNSAFKGFTKDLGAALSYKAISPAEPLGITGFDIGVEITGTKLSSIDEWGDAIDSDISLLPFPKLHAHKGLPFGIDVGLVYSSLPKIDVAYVGGELRYSFVSGNLAIPAIAIRGTYTQLLGADNIDLTTKGIEATISKGFLFFTPYAGVGNIWTSSEVSYTDTTTNLSTTLSADPSLFKWFIGLNINLGLINFVGEVDQTGDAKSYSIKMGFRF